MTMYTYVVLFWRSADGEKEKGIAIGFSDNENKVIIIDKSGERAIPYDFVQIYPSLGFQIEV